MRNRLIAVSLSLLAVTAAGKTSPSAKIAQLPKGMLAGHVYINDAVGVTYEYPGDWNATPDPQEHFDFDPLHPGGPTTQCLKVLLRLDAPNKVEGRFSAEADLLAIDPRCLTIVPFPEGLRDRADVDDLADVIIKRFKNSLFFSPYGVTILASEQHGRTIIQLTGAMTINAIEGHPAPAKEPLDVTTSFSLTESIGYWIAWAHVADAPSAEELKQVKISFKDARSSH
jgi:hypothetical protein